MDTSSHEHINTTISKNNMYMEHRLISETGGVVGTTCAQVPTSSDYNGNSTIGIARVRSEKTIKSTNGRATASATGHSISALHGQPTAQAEGARGPMNGEPSLNAVLQPKFSSRCASTVVADPNREAKQHITVWHKTEKRKVAGSAAPLLRNVHKYLQQNDQYELYTDQDKVNGRRPVARRTQFQNVRDIYAIGPGERIPVWHILEKRQISGNAAPLKKNIEKYLQKNPHLEIFTNQTRGMDPMKENNSRKEAQTSTGLTYNESEGNLKTIIRTMAHSQDVDASDGFVQPGEPSDSPQSSGAFSYPHADRNEGPSTTQARANPVKEEEDPVLMSTNPRPHIPIPFYTDSSQSCKDVEVSREVKKDEITQELINDNGQYKNISTNTLNLDDGGLYATPSKSLASIEENMVGKESIDSRKEFTSLHEISFESPYKIDGTELDNVNFKLELETNDLSCPDIDMRGDIEENKNAFNTDRFFL